jgi:16S rRNA (adenine1518-N6/adenine1519-N6)-dimethyltransferase
LAAIERLPSLGEGLRMAGFRPRKALGQHFLLDLNLTRKIARAAAPEAAAAIVTNATNAANA